MSPRVVIRCDGGTDIGMGHVVRCLALADMLKTDFEVLFVLQQTSSDVIRWIHSMHFKCLEIPKTTDLHADCLNLMSLLKKGDRVVLDNYSIQSDYQKKITEAGYRLVVIDDLNAWHQHAHLVINHSAGANAETYSRESYTKILAGPAYALIRKEFLEFKRGSGDSESQANCIISFGASDIQNLTYKYCKYILQNPQIDQLHLLVSTINPHFHEISELADQHSEKVFVATNLSATQMIELMCKSKIMICPASTISLETCAIGLGLISGYTAANQMSNYEGLLRRGVLIPVGDMNSAESSTLNDAITYLCGGSDKYSEMINKQKELVDHKSPERILKAFQSL